MATNVKIKTFPSGVGGESTPATTKVFLRSGSEKKRGCRPLEPGEVVALDDAEAKTLLEVMPNYLEVTFEKPTRPLYFSSQSEAELTSASFNPSTYGRADEAKKAMEAVKTAMDIQAAKEQELAEREAAIARRELQLDLIDDNTEPTVEDQLDADLEGYVPDANNAVSRDGLSRERAKAVEENEKTQKADKAERPVRTRRQRGTK